MGRLDLPDPRRDEDDPPEYECRCVVPVEAGGKCLTCKRPARPKLVRCDGGDGQGCFIPHAACVCVDEGTPGLRREDLTAS